MRWSGWQLCVPMSPTRENKRCPAMATTLMCLGEIDRSQTRMGGSLYLAAQQTMQGLLKKLCRDHYFDFRLRDRLQQQIARQKHHQPAFAYDTKWAPARLTKKPKFRLYVQSRVHWASHNLANPLCRSCLQTQVKTPHKPNSLKFLYLCLFTFHRRIR